MQSWDEKSGSRFSYVDLEAPDPQDHHSRTMREPTDTTTPTTQDADHPEARGKQATLSHMDHALMENPHGIVVDALASQAAVWAECLAGEVMQI